MGIGSQGIFRVLLDLLSPLSVRLRLVSLVVFTILSKSRCFISKTYMAVMSNPMFCRNKSKKKMLRLVFKLDMLGVIHDSAFHSDRELFYIVDKYSYQYFIII